VSDLVSTLARFEEEITEEHGFIDQGYDLGLFEHAVNGAVLSQQVRHKVPESELHLVYDVSADLQTSRF